MKNYKITWKIRSPLITSLESDTIFGHLCWALKFIKGEKDLTELLAATEKGEFLLSSAFPSGYLPSPFLPEKQIALDRVYVVNKYKKINDELLFNDENDFYAWKKKFKKNAYIPIKIWSNMQSSYSTAKFLDSFIMSSAKMPDEKRSIEVTGFRNRINRVKGTVEDGSLFAERYSFFKNDVEFTSYIKTDFFNMSQLKELLNYISLSGFGRKKSIGKGSFDILIEEFDFVRPDKVNAHLVLSNMIPAEDDPIDAYWNGNVKFGKLGGEFANTETPFKLPFYHFLPGSVFIGDVAPKGRCISVHHQRAEIIQNLTCYSIPFFWEGKND